ncbi:mitochondrial import inner membrane translocase subunit tim54 [Nowakowskiella sp. JEL0407]|nr:mitochondrial import inner membrane translocase subunit tim54 [Nowakowskiella sp. JEL0407]
MNYLTAIRSKLPSRNWLIFLGSVASITSVIAYDSKKCSDIKAEYKLKAKEIADQPLNTSDPVRKLIIYIAPTELARWSFKRHVKPVLDAAALDYEIFDASRPGRIQKSVRERIWDGKDIQKESDEKSALLELQKKKFNESWWSLLFPYPFDQVEEVDIMERARGPRYSSDIGLVAIGRDAWRELLNGIEEGSFGDRLIPEDTATNTSDAEKTKDAKSGPKPWVKPTCSDDNFPTDSFKFPPIAYIPAKNLEGMSSLPGRFWDWINERKTMAAVGKLALDIAFDKTRDLTKDDLNLGAEFESTSAAKVAVKQERDEVPPMEVTVSGRIIERLKVYTA